MISNILYDCLEINDSKELHSLLPGGRHPSLTHGCAVTRQYEEHKIMMIQALSLSKEYHCSVIPDICHLTAV